MLERAFKFLVNLSAQLMVLFGIFLFLIGISMWSLWVAVTLSGLVLVGVALLIDREYLTDADESH
jgi:hypothetical protein